MPDAMSPRGAWPRLQRLLSLLFTAFLAFSWAVPLIWAIIASTRPDSEPLARGDIWFGSIVTLASYTRALSLAPFDLYYVNTIIIVSLILGVQLITITLAAFAFAHYQFIGTLFQFSR